jgi:hypothetical protein
MLTMLTNLISGTWLARVLHTTSCWTMAGEEVRVGQFDLLVLQPSKRGFETLEIKFRY